MNTTHITAGLVTFTLAAAAAQAQQPAPAGAPGRGRASAAAAQPGGAAERPAFKKITRARFDALLKEPGKVLVLDVRRPDELQTIGGFPVYVSIQAKELEQHLAFLPKDRAIVTVSNHAGRAGRAAELLEKHGFTVAGSIGAQDYEAEGGTLVKIAAPPPRDGQPAAAAGAAGQGARAAAASRRRRSMPRPRAGSWLPPSRRRPPRAPRWRSPSSTSTATWSRCRASTAPRAAPSPARRARRAPRSSSACRRRQVSDAIAAGTPLPVTLTPAGVGTSGIVTNQGGVPLFIDGKLAGAVGVGGSSSAEDERFAKSGVDAVVPPRSSSR